MMCVYMCISRGDWLMVGQGLHYCCVEILGLCDN